MIEYGIIEDGYLRIKTIEPIENRRLDEDGNIEIITLTEEEQIAQLPKGWKPVERIDESLMTTDNPDYIVVPVPYDKGNVISYKYEVRFDTQKVRSQIQELKDNLAASDYKITKCYEATMTSQPLPYDLQSVVMQRQEIRDKINELESLL